MDNKGFREFHLKAIREHWAGIKRLRKQLRKINKRVFKNQNCPTAKKQAGKVSCLTQYLWLEEGLLWRHYKLLPEVQGDVSLRTPEMAERFAASLSSKGRLIKWLKNQPELEVMRG